MYRFQPSIHHVINLQKKSPADKTWQAPTAIPHTCTPRNLLYITAIPPHSPPAFSTRAQTHFVDHCSNEVPRIRLNEKVSPPLHSPCTTEHVCRQRDGFECSFDKDSRICFRRNVR